MNLDLAPRAGGSADGESHVRAFAAKIRVPRGLAAFAVAIGVVKTCLETVLMSAWFPAYPGWIPAATALVWNVPLLALLLVGVVVAQRRAAPHAPRWYDYAAVALGVALVGALLGTFFERVLDLHCCYSGPVPPAWSVFASGFAQELVFGVFVVLALAYRSAGLQRIESLRATQLERAQLARQAHESRLQALQARVEPQFLFSTLTQVEELYESDASRAGRMLDELIVYLRSALPQMRDTSSTVAKEIALAQAYLNIARIRLADRLTIEITAPDGACDLRFPPMVLLPLIDAAVGAEVAGSASARNVGIAVATIDSTLRLAVRFDVEPASDSGRRDDTIANVRDRLQALYGDNASIRADPAAGGAMQVLVEVPIERA